MKYIALLALAGCRIGFDDTKGFDAASGDGVAPCAWTLLRQPDPPPDSAPYAVGTADLNHDGHIDLLVGESGTDMVSVKLGNGDGTFRQRFIFPTDIGPQAILAHDFDGDGVPDVAVPTAAGASMLDLYSGLGDGAFVPNGTYATGSVPLTIAAVDVDRNGTTDLVVSELMDGAVSVYRGDGHGSFQPKQDYVAGGLAHYMTVGDVDHDGISDILVSDQGAASHLAVLIGNADGTFGAPQLTQIDFGGGAIAAGDVDADGNLDVVVTEGSAATVLLGNGDGTFRIAGTVGLIGITSNELALADLDLDGRLDLVTDERNLAIVVVAVGNGDGTFQTPIQFPTDGQAQKIAIADFDGDGRADVAVASQLGNVVDVFLDKCTP